MALPRTNERVLLDLLEQKQPLLRPMNVGHFLPTNWSNQLPRPVSHHANTTVSPRVLPITLTPPAVPERSRPGPPMPLNFRINPSHNHKNSQPPVLEEIPQEVHVAVTNPTSPNSPSLNQSSQICSQKQHSKQKILHIPPPPPKKKVPSIGCALNKAKPNTPFSNAPSMSEQKIMCHIPQSQIGGHKVQNAGGVPRNEFQSITSEEPTHPSQHSPNIVPHIVSGTRGQPPMPPPNPRQMSDRSKPIRNNLQYSVLRSPNDGNKHHSSNAVPNQNDSLHNSLRRSNQILEILNMGLIQNSDEVTDQAHDNLTQIRRESSLVENMVHATKIELANQEPTNKILQTSGQIQALPQNEVKGKISVRQDSNVSSDSYSQSSSPSYTGKSMETPLLPNHVSVKTSNSQYSGYPESQHGLVLVMPNGITDTNGVANAAITKSISTPASLQTVVRFHHGSNMSLHHRIIRDMRRPSRSSRYMTRGMIRFRFAQLLFNAVALLAIAGGLAAYFKAYPTSMRYVNQNLSSLNAVTYSPQPINPAPGICLPVIVSFCLYHKIPYNFTMFPNYMGHFTQRDAMSELEVYDAVVDVRCYELAALFLCSVFVPKCGPTGQLVRPCRNLCHETKRRCGFFLEVFGLTLPDYLDCNFFPESADDDVCVGHKEVIEEKIRAQKPVCVSGFQCDARRCIPADWRCDGHVDCEDQSDELNCETCTNGMIHCGEKRCVAQTHMCDGIIDCPWGQDERNCMRLSARMGEEGEGRLEVFHPEDQKWHPACAQHWDRNTSATIVCNKLGYQTVDWNRLTLEGGNMSLSTTPKYSPAIWEPNKQKHSNFLKQLRSCSEKNQATVDLSCSNYACGKRRHTRRLSSRIVGGTASSPGDWPFLAALLGGPEEIFYCAGVLIGEQWVLTASHCVGNFSLSEPSGWTIQLGITRRHAHSYFGQKMQVKRVVPHPMYNVGVTHDNDVALFQLKSPVTFHEQLLPVCLPPANHELEPGTICTVVGWGKREDKDVSEYEPTVNEVRVPVLNRDLCNSWLQHRDLNVTDGMICAGYAEGGKDACQGDSGGPLLCMDSTNHWFVGGIVSWGIKCAHPHLPGVYAYVPRYVPWIKQQMDLYNKKD